jgi:hypothetical protein
MAENPDLKAVQKLLVDFRNRLEAKFEQTLDPVRSRAIGGEIIELNHRIIMLGSILFADRTSKITVAADKVKAAQASVKAAIDNINKLKKFLNSISRFLALVDKVIDLAKLL